MFEGFNSIDVFLVDAHVHIYPCFDVNALLNSAAENFIRSSRQKGCHGNYLGVLLLSESSQHNWFETVYRKCSNENKSSSDVLDWVFSVFDDDECCLIAKNKNGCMILIVRGYQVITKEGLEVLTLATCQRVEDGLSANEVLHKGMKLDAICVLPWAVGKWLGKRGALIHELIRKHNDYIFLGDNSGRPWLWFTDSRMRRANKMGIGLINGTDPLPLAGQDKIVGSFGSIISNLSSKSNPSEIVKDSIRKSNDAIRQYGRLTTVKNFISNQMQLRNNNK